MNEEPEDNQIPMRYPDHPGYQDMDTSKTAAESMLPTAETLRKAVIWVLRKHGRLTVHESAHLLDLDIPSIQPRFSELKEKELIRDTGVRRENKSGRTAAVWEIRNA